MKLMSAVQAAGRWLTVLAAFLGLFAALYWVSHTDNAWQRTFSSSPEPSPRETAKRVRRAGADGDAADVGADQSTASAASPAKPSRPSRPDSPRVVRRPTELSMSLFKDDRTASEVPRLLDKYIGKVRHQVCAGSLGTISGSG
ncbi:MAG: hypothetical protein AAF499_06110, partial [Pseudomonadota bacterium]